MKRLTDLFLAVVTVYGILGTNAKGGYVPSEDEVVSWIQAVINKYNYLSAAAHQGKLPMDDLNRVAGFGPLVDAEAGALLNLAGLYQNAAARKIIDKYVSTLTPELKEAFVRALEKWEADNQNRSTRSDRSFAGDRGARELRASLSPPPPTNLPPPAVIEIPSCKVGFASLLSRFLRIKPKH